MLLRLNMSEDTVPTRPRLSLSLPASGQTVSEDKESNLQCQGWAKLSSLQQVTKKSSLAQAQTRALANVPPLVRHWPHCSTCG